MRSYYRKPKRGKYLIDGKSIWCDSAMEAEFILSLVNHGFSNKWRRPKGGLAYGFSHYTPDVELSISHDSMNRRAIVEFKPTSATEFSYADRQRMLGSAKFYQDAVCLLYIKKTNQWHIIEPHGTLSKTSEPMPSGIRIEELPRPHFMIPIFNTYGRLYWTRPSTLIAKRTSDGLEFIVKALFYSSKKRWRKK